jgi:hypothetical protein
MALTTGQPPNWLDPARIEERLKIGGSESKELPNLVEGDPAFSN